MITAVAQSEREMIRERQAEGIAIAKKTPGKYPGRRRRLNSDHIREIRNAVASGVPKAQIPRTYGVSRNTLYRHLGQLEPHLP
ncbi:DNA-binding protein [Brachybacterium avium]|uniref:DNA-binding protein n=1 Tax=Brachybacterium avium TaxID=2017485 RepID=A0A220U987_9MICO|nr:helix-turn-helix domain-containing protein [Brachybacterium avium]ASK64864.1 DNA-binding protein [Brachybacterium avium]